MSSICIFLLSQSSADFFKKSWSLGWLKLTFNMCFISQDKWQMSQESQEITPLALLKQSLWLTYNILGKKGEKSNKIWHYGMVGRYSCAFVFQYSIVGMLLWGFEIAALIRTNFVCVYDPFWGGWIFWGYQKGMFNLEPGWIIPKHVVLANFVDQSLILLHLQIKRFLGVFSLRRREWKEKLPLAVTILPTLIFLVKWEWVSCKG